MSLLAPQLLHLSIRNTKLLIQIHAIEHCSRASAICGGLSSCVEMPTSRMVASSRPSYSTSSPVPADVPGKVVEDGSSAWTLAISVGDSHKALYSRFHPGPAHLRSGTDVGRPSSLPLSFPQSLLPSLFLSLFSLSPSLLILQLCHSCKEKIFSSCYKEWITRFLTKKTNNNNNKQLVIFVEYFLLNILEVSAKTKLKIQFQVVLFFFL